MLEATMGLATEALGQWLASGQPVPVYQRGAMSQAYMVTCADGLRIGLHLSSPDKFWQQLCEALEEPALVVEYPTRQHRVSGYEALAARLDSCFRRHDRAHWLQVLQRHDVPYAAENELQDLPHDPQVRHLEMFHEIHHPVRGPVRAMRRPVRIDGQRESASKPPPMLGEHTIEVLRETGVAVDEIEGLLRTGIVAQC
jgi:crotonobetainyl-CoA:carnitine CoA-transferase CaiB-like acyl-CoA transferase